jgi:sulfopyruvate decarboxylase subunit alpha
MNPFNMDFANFICEIRGVFRLESVSVRRERNNLIEAEAILAEIRKNQITHVVGVPDNGSRVLYQRLCEDPKIQVIPVTQEGEAFALASGLFLGGANPLVLIQNTGFLESGDAFRGTVFNMGIPLVMIIGYRGYDSMRSGSEPVDTAATFFEPTLTAWNIPYFVMRFTSESNLISVAFSKAVETSLPAAVIYPGEIV